MNVVAVHSLGTFLLLPIESLTNWDPSFFQKNMHIRDKNEPLEIKSYQIRRTIRPCTAARQ